MHKRRLHLKIIRDGSVAIGVPLRRGTSRGVSWHDPQLYASAVFPRRYRRLHELPSTSPAQAIFLCTRNHPRRSLRKAVTTATKTGMALKENLAAKPTA